MDSSPRDVQSPYDDDEISSRDSMTDLNTNTQTVRDFQTKLADLNRENFDLKLRMFFLEQNGSNGINASSTPTQRPPYPSQYEYYDQQDPSLTQQTGYDRMASSVVAYRRKRALIIGINQYLRNSDSLRYCINDATDLNTTLQRIGFETSLELDCNYNELENKIDEFAKKIERDDLVLFYFAGHGKQNEDENYLLPSDYDYDYRGYEHNYIVNHAINIKYIMKKIDSKKCRITIYLFDCCRLKTKMRPRAMLEKQGLAPIAVNLQTLVVFACAPGEATLDETWNNRNGSFIENLLEDITTQDKDIEEIMKKVAGDVHQQTAGVQLPYRTSSLVGKVYLVTKNNRENDKTHGSYRHSDESGKYTPILNTDPLTQTFVTTPTADSNLDSSIPTNTNNLQFDERVKRIQDENNALKKENNALKSRSDEISDELRHLQVQYEKQQEKAEHVIKRLTADCDARIADLKEEQKQKQKQKLEYESYRHQQTQTNSNNIEEYFRKIDQQDRLIKQLNDRLNGTSSYQF